MLNRLLFASVVIASVVVAPSAQASIFATTTLTFDTPINIGDPLNRTFDSLEIGWSTPLMSGFVGADNLTDLSFSLVNGGTTVYQDDAIVGGVVQPIGRCTSAGKEGMSFQTRYDRTAKARRERGLRGR